MGKQRPTPLDYPPVPPAMDPDIREMQLTNLAMALAEKQMREGTASSSVICHYLKLGSQREQTELEKLKIEKELAMAKIKAIESSAETEKLYKDAMVAFAKYSGTQVVDDDDIMYESDDYAE